MQQEAVGTGPGARPGEGKIGSRPETVCVVINENAGSQDATQRLESALNSNGHHVWRRSEGPGHATVLAREAAAEGFDVVAAAGGDGTVHEVVNGLVEEGRDTTLAIIPMGTGNDLARTLNLPDDPEEALALITNGERRPIDVFRATTGGRTVWGINAAAGGFSGQVDEAISAELKAQWGPFAYLIAAASVVSDVRGYDALISLDEESPFRLDVLNVVVANGRTIGGGKRVAPLADPFDGLLDIVLMERGSAVAIGEAGARLIAGGFLDSPLVTHRRAHSVHIESTPGMTFNIDGELLTQEAVTFAIEPRALRVVVGESEAE